MANAAASLRCPVDDYARFLAVAMLPARSAAPDIHSAQNLQLSARSRALFLQAQIETRREWTDKSCGWNLEQTRFGRVFWHGGNNGNMFKTFALGDAERQQALVVMTNARGGSVLYPAIVRAATGLDLLAFAG